MCPWCGSSLGEDTHDDCGPPTADEIFEQGYATLGAVRHDYQAVDALTRQPVSPLIATRQMLLAGLRQRGCTILPNGAIFGPDGRRLEIVEVPRRRK